MNLSRLSLLFMLSAVAATPQTVHTWEKQELTFTAARAFANPYTDVVVWVDLTGPDFSKRVYGFWDGWRHVPRAPGRNPSGHVELAERIGP